GLLLSQRLHIVLDQLWRRHIITYVTPNEPPTHRILQSLAKHHMHISHTARSKPLLQLLSVERLYQLRRQLVQVNVTQRRKDMVIKETAIVQVGTLSNCGPMYFF